MGTSTHATRGASSPIAPPLWAARFGGGRRAQPTRASARAGRSAIRAPSVRPSTREHVGEHVGVGASLSAEARFDEGLKLHDTGNENEARLKFAQAWAVLKRPNVLFNLARSEQLSNHPVEALVHFQDFVKMPGISSQDKADAEARTVELKKQVGRVEVKGAPEGAKILIDDAWTGETTPVLGEVHALPGKRIVEVKTSTKSYRKEVTCNAQETTVVSFEEEVRANPPEGWKPPETEPKKKMFPPPTGAIVLGGLGLVGLGLGVGFGVASSSAKDSNATRGATAGGVCSTQPSAQVCVDGRATRDSQQTTALVSVVSYVGGGVLLAGAVAWWLIFPRKAKEAPASGFIPVVGPTYAGASWQSSF